MELSPELRPYIEAANRSPLKERLWQKTGRQLITEGEVRPGDIAPVIATNQKGFPSSYPMAFGFPTETGNLILNARSETAGEKYMFKEAWARCRCIIPTSWYYEWQHYVLQDGRKKTGDKYMFRSVDSKVTWICGLYRIDGGLPHFVILTKNAPEEIRAIHGRMPVILPASAVRDWIDPAADPAAILDQTVCGLAYEKAQ